MTIIDLVKAEQAVTFLLIKPDTWLSTITKVMQNGEQMKGMSEKPKSQ